MIALVLAAALGAVSPDSPGEGMVERPPDLGARTADATVPPAVPLQVYRLRPAVDIPVMAAAALAAAVPNLLASKIIRERCPCDPGEVNGFDRPAIGNHSGAAATVSDVTAALALLGPPILDFVDLGPGPALVSDLGVFGETLLVNAAIVEIVKYTVQRPLPRTYAGDPALLRDPEGYRSFYSGHASTTAAALSATAFTLRLRYGERIWPWIVAGAASASVAVERVAAGEHFPTDVLVGLAAGLAVGVTVPWLHALSPWPNLAFAPAAAGRGLSVVGRF